MFCLKTANAVLGFTSLPLTQQILRLIVFSLFILLVSVYILSAHTPLDSPLLSSLSPLIPTRSLSTEKVGGVVSVAASPLLTHDDTGEDKPFDHSEAKNNVEEMILTGS